MKGIDGSIGSVAFRLRGNVVHNDSRSQTADCNHHQQQPWCEVHLRHLVFVEGILANCLRVFEPGDRDQRVMLHNLS